MRFSISTGTLFTYPLPKIFEMTAEAGFDGLELIINQDFEHVDARKLVAELSSILPILSIHSPFMPLSGWGNPIESLKRSVELATETGIPLITFHPPSWLDFELRFWRWMYRVSDFQEEIGGGKVNLALENMPCEGKLKINKNILSQSEKMVRFITEKNLYQTFDCTHIGTRKIDFIREFYLFYNSGRIKNIHFSDYGHGRQHLLPGQGILPLTRFLNHLCTAGYDETLTLEIFPHAFPDDERIIVDSLKEILKYLRRETTLPHHHASSPSN